VPPLLLALPCLFSLLIALPMPWLLHAPLQNRDANKAVYCLSYVLSTLFMWNVMGIRFTARELDNMDCLAASTAVLVARAPAHSTAFAAGE
jgi:hypothetical protein